MLLKHEAGDATELNNSQVLGDDSPLQFDADGYAEIGDRRGELLLSMHRHIGPGGRKRPADGDGDTDTDTDTETGADPETLTKSELYDMASEAGIEGRSSMDKGELIDALFED